jgi:hypothetical protein
MATPLQRTFDTEHASPAPRNLHGAISEFKVLFGDRSIGLGVAIIRTQADVWDHSVASLPLKLTQADLEAYRNVIVPDLATLPVELLYVRPATFRL